MHADELPAWPPECAPPGPTGRAARTRPAPAAAASPHVTPFVVVIDTREKPALHRLKLWNILPDQDVCNRGGIMRKPSAKVLAWVAEQEGKHACVCGCGQIIVVRPSHFYEGVPTHVHGHNGRKPNAETDSWVQENQGHHFCGCGCGEAIEIKRFHRKRGIPKFVLYHGWKDTPAMQGLSGSANGNYKGGRKVTNGYVYILVGTSGGRPVYREEHRLVMEALIGRELDDSETVHHKNGIRSDNSPDNLELWASNHPAGQRVSDLLTFAVGLLRTYADATAIWPPELRQTLAGLCESGLLDNKESGHGR